MVNEPTQEEILRWKARLEDRDFQRRLMGFQDHVYRVFEDLRRRTGLELIRTILKRDEVKSLESVINKIWRLREEGNTGDFSKTRDLVGIKILCPYKKNVQDVIKYLYSQSNKSFRIVEKIAAKAKRKYPYGYTGYHFTVYPVLGAPSGWTPLYCEVQIKTIIEEAWDSKTHDLSYKRKKDIPEQLHTYFTHLSGILREAESLGESIYEEIRKLLGEAQRHRNLAILATFANSIATLERMTKIYAFMPRKKLKKMETSYFSMNQINIRERLTLEESWHINEAIRCEYTAGRLDEDICYAAAFVAICQRDPAEPADPEQVAFALQLASELTEHRPNDPRIEILKAHLNWVFGRFSHSIEQAEQIYEKIKRDKSLNDLNLRAAADFSYYVADAAALNYFVPEQTIESVRKLALKLEKSWKYRKKDANWLGIADTVGFVKIVLGKSAGEVIEGIKLVDEVQKLSAQQDSWYIKNVARAYSARHKRMGEKNLNTFNNL